MRSALSGGRGLTLEAEDLESKAQEEERKTQAQEATIVQLKKQVELLAAGVQKVSDQVQPNKNALQVVAQRAARAR